MTSRFLDTAAAALYLGFGTRAGIRHCVYRGELIPDGRGYRGGYVFTTETLDALLRSRKRPAGSPVQDRVPEGSDLQPPANPSTQAGWIYAIALTPDVNLGRFKIGWTTKPIAQRLRSYRTTNPTAILLGLWDGERSDEARAHELVDGRIGESEVFQCAAPWTTLTRLNAALRGQVS